MISTRIRARRGAAYFAGALALLTALGGGMARSSEGPHGGKKDHPDHPAHPAHPAHPDTPRGPKIRCTTDADCPTDLVCRENGKCMKPKKDFCTSDDQCDAGEICRNDKCHKGQRCHEDADCADDQRCDDGLCVDTTPPPTTPPPTTPPPTTPPPTIPPPAPKEICGDCIDNDGNGLTDFEDPACCGSETSAFVLALRHGKLVPQGETAKLKLAGVIASPAAANTSVNAEGLFIQVRPQGGSDILCAQIPGSSLKLNGRVLAYRAGKSPVASAKGLDSLLVKARRDGSVKFKAKARHAQIAALHPGALQVTFGFLGKAGDTENRCSSLMTSFRPAGRAMVSVR